MSALVLLPVVAFLLMWLLLAGRSIVLNLGASWAGNFLLAGAFWGLFVALSSELLSLFNAINRLWLAVEWGALAGLLAYFGWRSGYLARAWRQVKEARLRLDRLEKAALLILAGILSILLLIALVSPPNNADSFIYHMARVVHWAENHSLRHYPAYVDHQLHKPIFAETAILHLRILFGGDRVANLVQYFSMFGSLIAAAGIAKLLGAGRKGQLLTAFFVVSIPMGILQATSTQNDYVAAFWAVSLAYFVVQSVQRPLTRIELSATAAIFGLGVLTKGTFFVYFPPLLAWYFLHRMRNGGVKKTLLEGLLMLAAAFVLNLGFWTRDIITFGGPYGSSDWLQRNLGVNVEFLDRFFPPDTFEPAFSPVAAGAGGAFDPLLGRSGTAGKLLSQPKALHSSQQAAGSALSSFIKEYPSALARTIGRNFTNPFGIIARALARFVDAFPGLFGQGMGDELLRSAWNHEDHAGNLHHLLFVPLAIFLIAIQPKQQQKPWAYIVAVLGTYLLLPVVIGHADSYWGVRYQLPFFVLWGPISGLAISGFRREWLTALSLGLLALASLPWLLLNNTRPLIGMPPWPTKIESILVAPQAEVLLANNVGLVDDYTLTARAILESGCQNVGLRIETGFLEYPIWWLLNAPQNGIRVEVINVGLVLERYVDPEFKPCAVACTICGDRVEFNGLELAGKFDTITLFLAPDLSPR